MIKKGKTSLCSGHETTIKLSSLILDSTFFFSFTSRHWCTRLRRGCRIITDGCDRFIFVERLSDCNNWSNSFKSLLSAPEFHWHQHSGRVGVALMVSSYKVLLLVLLFFLIMSQDLLLSQQWVLHYHYALLLERLD